MISQPDLKAQFLTGMLNQTLPLDEAQKTSINQILIQSPLPPNLMDIKNGSKEEAKQIFKQIFQQGVQDTTAIRCQLTPEQQKDFDMIFGNNVLNVQSVTSLSR